MSPTAEQLLSDARTAILEAYVPSRERSLALTKLDETELWLTRTQMEEPR
jgi:hypothetical protein